MRTLFRCITADFRKTRRLSFRVAHLLIPVCVAGIFLLYYRIAPWSAQRKIVVYFQTLAMGFPILISLFSVMLAEQELSASSYQTMLSVPKRLPVFYSKFILLVVSGVFSAYLAGILYGAGSIYILKMSVFGMQSYMSASFILIVGNIFIYIFHWFLALRYNKGISIIVGLMESIVTALLLTGIGDRTWYFIPCAWASRMITYMLSGSIEEQSCLHCHIAATLCGVLTVGAIILYGIWACRWEGKHTTD